jgi:XRE family aerobic/anaerobic benzoate catabolism transcriptional regulator
VPEARGRSSVLDRIVDLLGQLPPDELPAIAELIEKHSGRAAAADRAQRIALVGLRGAGKSTLGRKLADQLDYPFVELNRMIEQEYGASLPMLIEMSGLATFRRYERACLERVLAEHPRVVIATAGGIVSEPLTFDLILSSFYTIWLKAEPEEHMARVRAQGDLRPMADDGAAMEELRTILKSREPLYARASAVLDTAQLAVDDAASRLIQMVSPVLCRDACAFNTRSAVV